MFGRFKTAPKLRVLKSGAVIFILAGLVFFLYFWRLGTLTTGLSTEEANVRTATSSIQNIIDNPVNAPHKLPQFISQHFFGNGAADLRVVSLIFGIFFLFCFYRLARGWFGMMVGFFTTVLLAATPWFILLVRSATPSILFLAPLAILTSYYWFAKSKSTKAFYVVIITAATSIYVPGMAWLVLLTILIARKELTKAAEGISWYVKLLALLLIFILLAPIIYATIKDTNLIKALLLIPQDWSPAVEILKSIAWAFLSLVWRTQSHVEFIIGRLPMLNIAQLALSVFGFVALYRLARKKLYILASVSFFAILAAGLNKNLAGLTLALPALAIAMAAGLRYLYMEWRSVFPKNPIPKYLALFLISILAALHVGYGIRYSLVAWPNTTETRNTFIHK